MQDPESIPPLTIPSTDESMPVNETSIPCTLTRHGDMPLIILSLLLDCFLPDSFPFLAVPPSRIDAYPGF